MAERIGFVGVGRMGSNMARRLKECGYEIGAVYDVNTAAAQALAQELGCLAAEQLKQVTKASDIIITVVTDDKAMKKIYNGGLLSRSKGKLFINCATITPEVHVWVEAKAEKAGAQSLEGCMASSITQARQGTLYLMCGGKPEVFERAKPILEKLAASTRYIGPAGKAAEVKALVNGEDMQNREHSCFFSAAHAAKDSGIALKLGKAQGLNLPLALATKKQYDRMVTEGLGELDKSGVAELTFKGRHQPKAA
jgi:3-hydroxyisobutyrate dehydrogenase